MSHEQLAALEKLASFTPLQFIRWCLDHIDDVPGLVAAFERLLAESLYHDKWAALSDAGFIIADAIDAYPSEELFGAAPEDSTEEVCRGMAEAKGFDFAKILVMATKFLKALPLLIEIFSQGE